MRVPPPTPASTGRQFLIKSPVIHQTNPRVSGLEHTATVHLTVVVGLGPTIHDFASREGSDCGAAALPGLRSSWMPGPRPGMTPRRTRGLVCHLNRILVRQIVLRSGSRRWPKAGRPSPLPSAPGVHPTSIGREEQAAGGVGCKPELVADVGGEARRHQG